MAIQKFSEQLRQAISECGYSQIHLAKLCDIDATQLNRFVNRKRRISLDDIDAICRVIGGRLAIDVGKKRKK
jgi:transcriptional regulator with XRE-family HTH domain